MSHAILTVGAVALVLVATGRSRAQSAEVGAETSDVPIPSTRFVLDNGLTVIVHEDHKAPIVAVNIWYHVGSKNERLVAPQGSWTVV